MTFALTADKWPRENSQLVVKQSWLANSDMRYRSRSPLVYGMYYDVCDDINNQTTKQGQAKGGNGADKTGDTSSSSRPLNV